MLNGWKKKYDFVAPTQPRDRFAKVRKNGKWGIVDIRTKQEIVPPIMEVTDVCEAPLPYLKNYMFSHFDHLIEEAANISNPRKPYRAYLIFFTKDNLWGLYSYDPVTKQLELKVEPKSTTFKIFQDPTWPYYVPYAFFAFKQNDKYTIYSTKFEQLVCEPRFSDVDIIFVPEEWGKGVLDKSVPYLICHEDTPLGKTKIIWYGVSGVITHNSITPHLSQIFPECDNIYYYKEKKDEPISPNLVFYRKHNRFGCIYPTIQREYLQMHVAPGPIATPLFWEWISPIKKTDRGVLAAYVGTSTGQTHIVLGIHGPTAQEAAILPKNSITWLNFRYSNRSKEGGLYGKEL